MAEQFNPKPIVDHWAAQRRPNQTPPDGDWSVWLIMAGRGFGKALALDTPIPTPTGWTTMGDLKVGDTVYDEHGQPCNVTFATPVQIGRTCFDVVFSDGTVIVADAEHRWLTIDRRTRKALRRRVQGPRLKDVPQKYAPSVVTTEQIKATLYDGKEVNHAIPVAGPLWGVTQHLLIDPYVFGLWLGDGSSKAAEITTADPEILRFIADAGYIVGSQRRAGGRSFTVSFSTDQDASLRRDGTTGRYVSVEGNVLSDLRTLGVYQNKHIPTCYLRSSVDQRTALLQGLMDTDGAITPGGAAEYVSVNEALARDVYELVTSLGFKASQIADRATLNGEDCGPRFRVAFTPHTPVFRLPRKLARQHAGKAQAERVRRRYIVDVRPRSSVPVRCIQVDSPNHLFLASRAMIPTHNTRTGAEWVREQIMRLGPIRVALVAPTAADARDVMVQGESGLLACCERYGIRAHYKPSLRRVDFPNGASAFLYSADEPERLRGVQHMIAWGDEIAAWRRPEAWDQLQFGMRLGQHPQIIGTTTPRPVDLVRTLLKRSTDGTGDVVVSRGATYENADNLAPSFLATLKARYEGTRLGRQEIAGELLEDVEGALWTYALIEQHRVETAPVDLARVVVAVDPPASSGAESAECGIVVAALGGDGDAYVIADRSVRGTPNEWANAAIAAYDAYEADTVVIEVNQGGEMATNTLRTVRESLPITSVRASRGKYARAEPISALYEQGRVHHVGAFPTLEEQMCTWLPDGRHASPDRIDALVWAMTELSVGGPAFSENVADVVWH